MARNEVKWGAVLSYALIIINAVYGFLITPYILSSIGDVEYGVYKTISSLSTSLMVLDLGIGGTVMRYVAKYKSEGNHRKIESFIYKAFGEGAILLGVITTVCSVIYLLLPTMYANGLNCDELVLGRQLFVVMACNLILHVVENLLGGIITGYNRFTFGNGMKLARILCRMALIYGLFLIVKSSLVLVLIDTALTLLLLVIEYLYIRKTLKVKIKLSFKGWDKGIFNESFKYTVLLFLTSIVAQMNNNLDNVVIGAIKGPSFVTVYSMGLLIFGMFENLSTAISGVMLPTVTNVLNEENGLQKVQGIVINVGRIQFALLGAAAVGFSIIGQDFIKLWLGEGYSEVYTITLILMLPSILELCVNVCLSVLRSKNMLGFRTTVLTSITVLNAVVTIVGVKYFGIIAAALGTAVSFVIGNLIVMNIYYYKKFSFRMVNIYLSIFKGTWSCLLLSGAALYVSSRYIFTEGWYGFVANVMVFCVVYMVTMWFFGLAKSEKQSIPILNSLFRIKRYNKND